MFLRDTAAVTGGDVTASFSLCVEFRDNQENGPVIFRVGGVGAAAGAVVGFGLVFGGDSVAGGDGDQGIVIPILPRESFLDGCFATTRGGFSRFIY